MYGSKLSHIIIQSFKKGVKQLQHEQICLHIN